MNPSHAISRPAVVDIRSCDEWLAHAPLLDSRHACASFVHLLDELQGAALAPATLLEILERLHRPMHRALREQARRFSHRSLPLGVTEESGFVQVCDLWLGLLQSWQLLRTASGQPLNQLGFARSLIALRTIESAAGLIQAHFAARRDVGPGLWRWLHQAYAEAEKSHVAEAFVPARPGEPSSCQSAYAQTLLLQLAHPYGLGARDLAWVQRWTALWARKVQFWRAAENGGGPAVDIDGDEGACWTPAGAPGAGLRFMDCKEVQRSIRRRLKKLREGANPAELGLGEDCTSPAADDLLAAIARCWGDAPHVRRYSRRETGSQALIAYGVDAIFAALAGRTFRDRDTPWSYSRQAADEMHIFQRALEREREQMPAAQAQSWDIIDESADGFQLRRQCPEERIALRQLIALLAPGTQRFMLCEVRWIRQAPARMISIGVHALHGLPQAATFRAAGDAGMARGWLPAFVLTGGSGAAPTLVLPPGLFGKDREAELRLDGGVQRIQLSALHRHGYDYDWVVFSGKN